jgi:hypothetical protein
MADTAAARIPGSHSHVIEGDVRQHLLTAHMLENCLDIPEVVDELERNPLGRHEEDHDHFGRADHDHEWN